MSDDRHIEQAAAILRSGGLVAFPTETVYGLGADATNAAAVRKIFEVKGRPLGNPLIVHVHGMSVAQRYARRFSTEAQTLAKKFWPGPLTIIVPKARTIVLEVTAGLETVGLRCPDHPLALALLREFDGPIAAPSANRSNRLSPTTAQHVEGELGGAVDLIVDGGPCQIGIESTVIDLASQRPLILRPGSITREQIETVIGPVGIGTGSVRQHEPARSPGQQPMHYSPRTPAFRFTRDRLGDVLQWCELHQNDPSAIVIIGGSPLNNPETRHTLVRMPTSAGAYARRLYSVLHELDNSGISAIFIEMPPDEAQWVAVRDRLIRATREF